MRRGLTTNEEPTQQGGDLEDTKPKGMVWTRVRNRRGKTMRQISEALYRAKKKEALQLKEQLEAIQMYGTASDLQREVLDLNHFGGV